MNTGFFRAILLFVVGISVLVILLGVIYFLGGNQLLAGSPPQVRIVQSYRRRPRACSMLTRSRAENWLSGAIPMPRITSTIPRCCRVCRRGRP